MDWTDEHKKLLHELLKESARKYVFPKEHLFRRQFKTLAEQLDELEAEGLIRTEEGCMLLTLSGLLRTSGHLAEEILKDCSELWQVLDLAYDNRSDGQKWTEAAELAAIKAGQGRTGQADEVAFTLHFLTDINGWYTDHLRGDTGTVSKIALSKGIYKINAGNWKQKFAAQLEANEQRKVDFEPLRPEQRGPISPTRDSLIFISFVRADEDLATAFHGILDAAGIRTFKSSEPEHGLPGGEAWFGNIVKMLRAATGLVYVATPRSVVEHWPTFEVAAVYARECPALTILTRGLKYDQAPSPLKNIQNVASDEPRDRIMAKIANAVGRNGTDLWTPRVAGKLSHFMRLARIPAEQKEPGQSKG